MRLFAISLIVAAVCASPAHAVQAYEGLAYARGSERLLYRESHWVDGARHLVLYRCRDGKAFARKRIDATAGVVSPDFELVDARDDYRHGVRSTPSGREVFVQAGRAAPRRASLGAAKPVIDAGFDAYLHGAWDTLAGAAGQTMPFLIPSRLRAMDFKVRQTGEKNGTRSFRLSVGAWFGGMLPQIDVDYASASRRLLRYRGISDIRNAKGGHLDVDVRFPDHLHRSAQAADLDAAAKAPLSGRCSL